MSERAFVQWARRHRIPLPDPIAATADLRRFLRGELAGRRLLFVGEADHWIHEKVEYRLAMTEAAIAAGFSWLGEELGWSDGTRFDRFLHGDGDRKVRGDRQDELERISLYGYRGDVRTDRDDSPTGFLKPSFERFPDPAFTAEHRRWLRALRGLPTERFFGFDVDATPGGAYADLGIPRVPGESLEEEVARLTRLLDDEPDPARRNALTTLRDSFVYVSMAHPAPTVEALNPAMAFRERVMHRHLDFALGQLPADRGLILYGHDLHLARDDHAIRAQGGAGPGGDSEPSLGHYLNARHADEIYVVWMVIGGGDDSQPYDELDRHLAPPRRSLNAILGRVGGSFVLPTGDGPRLRELLRMYHLYNTYSELALADQADAVCFIERVTPLRADGPGPGR